MDLRPNVSRPRRLLGLFSQRYSSKCPANQQLQCTNQQPDVEEEYSMPDEESSCSIYSNDEVALLRMTEQRDIVVKELRITKDNLATEKKLTNELNQRLIMKAINIDCQMADTEERLKQYQARIDKSDKKNKELYDKLQALRIENQHLMKRTAALARRDQIQKATILASNAEILKLMSTIEAFQERFLSLADAVVTTNEKNKEETNREISKASSNDTQDTTQTTTSQNTEDSDHSLSPFERDQISLSEGERAKKEMKAKEAEYQKKQKKWRDEKKDLFGCITKLKDNNKEIKSKFVQTLKKHQWKWHKEKEKLLTKVGELEVLLEEKEAELVLAKNTIAELKKGNRLCTEKGDNINNVDTFGTLTTEEDSLSTTSSNSSLTLTYSLTETSNNLSSHKRNTNSQTLDIFEPVDNGSYHFSVDSHYDETPPRKNNAPPPGSADLTPSSM